MFSPIIEKLINALRCLQGVGPKTAQRMAMQLLQHRENGLHLAQQLKETLTQVGHCKECNTFSETDICLLCNDSRRDKSLLCIVGTPIDVLALEQTGHYKGQYFVLMGHLSPLDGIGPKEIGIDKLTQRLNDSRLKEIVLATNTTVEGEATAHYIGSIIKARQITCTRIAYGVPMGGELEYLDVNTLSRAFSLRTHLD